LNGTSLIETVRFRNSYDWKKIEKTLIEEVQKTCGIIELPNTDKVDENMMLIKSREIAYDFYRINGIFKKVYESLVVETEKRGISDIKYFNVGL
jgi:hypothetical protein